MVKTSLCYLTYENEYLMLYRNKKENDPNAGKWIGVGGKLEIGETPTECAIREIYEETGIQVDLSHLTACGIVHFKSDTFSDEDMYLFNAKLPTRPDISDCNEGTLKWIPADKLLDLPMWQGDKIFLRKMANGETNINLTLVYSGDTLSDVID